MSSQAQTSHPNQQQLAAFAAEKLADAEREKLQAHLDHCPACRQDLARLPGAGESLYAQETVPLAHAASPLLAATMAHRPESPVPPDLANHPRYEVLQLLGQGGMGAVYKARHKKMDRLVALKVIKAQYVCNDRAIERFQREVQAAAKLDHTNIVRAFDADQAHDTHFLVMELVEGADLAEYIEKKGPLPVGHACHFIRQAALGLQHAYEKGMVHRDIKPHNLMLTPQGVVKVMDFGLARLATESASDRGLTAENVLMGTADYIAPEQAEDAHQADIRADIYSLGCALYHLLAGQPPFAGGNVVQKIAAHLKRSVPLVDLPGTTPESLRAVLAKMLDKDPNNRYQTPGEVAQALVPFLNKSSGLPPPPVSLPPMEERSERSTADESATPARRVPLRQRVRRWLVGGGLLVALLLGVGIIVLARWERPRPEQSTLPTPGPHVAAPPEKLPPSFTNKLGMELVLVPKGKCWMGGGGGRPGDADVQIGQDFYLGKYEVTQEEWEKVMGSNPSHHKAVVGVTKEDQKRFPVEMVSWDDVQLFLEAINKGEEEPGWVYRLPNAVEWEYACRGGPFCDKLDSAFDYYFSQATNQVLLEEANFDDKKGLGRTCKVGSYKPNRLGLYDMHGNVWEWCDDADGASQRVIRGGCWHNDSGALQAAVRSASSTSSRVGYIGLRVARAPVGSKERK